MYSNKTIYINIDNATEKIVDYRISGMNLKKPPKLPNKLEDIPTRLMLRVLDNCALQKGSKKDQIQNMSYSNTINDLLMEDNVNYTQVALDNRSRIEKDSAKSVTEGLVFIDF